MSSSTRVGSLRVKVYDYSSAVARSSRTVITLSNVCNYTIINGIFLNQLNYALTVHISVHICTWLNIKLFLPVRTKGLIHLFYGL